MTIPVEQITGLILAGGQGQRMGGLDKGLQTLHGEALTALVMRRLSPQVGKLVISANRNIDAYRQFGCEVIADQLSGFQGPLAGIHAGLMHCTTPWMLCVPCDSPLLPADLVPSLSADLITTGADLACVVTGTGTDRHEHPVFSLMRVAVRDSLARYLEGGGRKVRDWQASVNTIAVHFPDDAAFRNLNTAADLANIATTLRPESWA